MAVLTEEHRASVHKHFMSALSNEREPIGLLKADIRAAVDAIDDWVNANAAAINAALPQPFRGAATQAQKARLLTTVVAERYITDAGGS